MLKSKKQGLSAGCKRKKVGGLALPAARRKMATKKVGRGWRRHTKRSWPFVLQCRSTVNLAGSAEWSERRVRLGEGLQNETWTEWLKTGMEIRKGYQSSGNGGDGLKRRALGLD